MISNQPIIILQKKVGFGRKTKTKEEHLNWPRKKKKATETAGTGTTFSVKTAHRRDRFNSRSKGQNTEQSHDSHAHTKRFLKTQKK